MDITKLTQYIYSQLHQGLSVADITSQLRNASWAEADIAAGFAAAQAQLAPTPTPLEVLEPAVSSYQEQPATTQLPPPLQKSRIKIGWMLFKQSLRVIKQNPGLSRYIFMTILISFIILVILTVLIIVDSTNAQILFYPTTTDTDGSSSFGMTGLGFLVLVLASYLITFGTYYYGTALASHVLGIFRAKPETYAYHIALARKKLPTIALYALIATVIGYILRFIEERFKLIGLLISRILGALWSLATSFVLPVIADSDDNAVASIKESVALFKANWGQTITGRIALTGFVFLLYFLIGIPVSIVLLFILASLFGVVGVFIAIGLFILGLVIISILESLASNILNVSLYYYARYKTIPPSFSPELLASVFINKKKKK